MHVHVQAVQLATASSSMGGGGVLVGSVGDSLSLRDSASAV